MPRSARQIQRAVVAFQAQFQTACYLFVSGSLLPTGHTCLAPTWLSVCRIDPELDLLAIGDPNEDTTDADDENTLAWVAQTDHATLLLSSALPHH
ncbi:hypothetical protein KSZ_51270 [Dictyobacter formicarum]|uniref:Uncharacterized protein n=1 Tax=Dictyobacter formicarum TaxID=2778368 RepID=A0ABQ3VPU1_9CHLR|nr:hypothetical protein KSZ_51270 [Dictyobacter formicarum]